MLQNHNQVFERRLLQQYYDPAGAYLELTSRYLFIGQTLDYGTGRNIPVVTDLFLVDSEFRTPVCCTIVM